LQFTSFTSFTGSFRLLFFLPQSRGSAELAEVKGRRGTPHFFLNILNHIHHSRRGRAVFRTGLVKLLKKVTLVKLGIYQLYQFNQFHRFLLAAVCLLLSSTACPGNRPHSALLDRSNRYHIMLRYELINCGINSAGHDRNAVRQSG
jgi:hypothetical protein